MLRIKTVIEKSCVEGMGLFADQFVKKGTVTWEYDEDFDVGFTKEEIESLPEIDKEFVYKYTYFDKELGKFVLCIDNQRHINHSEKKDKINIDSSPHKDVANRDIQPGEELLCNYFLFDPEYFDRHGIKRKSLM